MKVSNQALTPWQIAALRIFSAGLVFIPFGLFHLKKIPVSNTGLLVVTGFLGNLLPAFCFAIALLKIDSSITGILNSLTPLCVVLTGVFIFGDKVKAKKIGGVAVGFAGLLLITLTQKNISLNNAGYSSLILLATLSYGFNVNLVSHYLKEIKPLYIATISLTFMSLPAGLLLWQQDFFRLDFSDSRIQWAIINCLLLGIVGSSIATFLFYLLVQKASGLFASLVTYGIPFVALFWGILDGETVSFISIICLSLILFGVYLANQPDKKKRDLNDPAI
jgi:drug/metabolite transporter (DMT)-like permease